jgi:hypothetical protein
MNDDEHDSSSDVEQSDDNMSRRSTAFTCLQDIEDERQKQTEIEASLATDRTRNESFRKEQASESNSESSSAAASKAPGKMLINENSESSKFTPSTRATYWENEFAAQDKLLKKQATAGHSSTETSPERSSDSAVAQVHESFGEKTSSSSTRNVHVELNRTDALPGAFAQAGPGGGSNSGVEERGDHEETASERASSAKSARTVAKTNGYESGLHGGDEIVNARPVSGAETIFDAEDVQRDFFKRNQVIIVTVGVLVLATIVTLSVTLTKPDNTFPEPPCKGHCCGPVENKSIPVQCLCTNSTEAMWDSFGSGTGPDIYGFALDSLQSLNVIDPNVMLDPEGCEIENQVFLIMSNFQHNVSLAELRRAPKNLIVEFYSYLYIYIAMGGIDWLRDDGWAESTEFCDWSVNCENVNLVA